MSKYQELITNPPRFTVIQTISKTKDPKEVIFKVVSCMCDNVHYFRFKKNNNDEFKLDCIGHHYGNFGIKIPKHELEWNADEGKWREVFNSINSGTSVIESVQSR
jgi:hypothetical protein